ncbi:hypothetical protein [Pseudomonas amygdali]|uniref:Uncharacterized protein n=2 Tax=Pseudomonas amygdali pv. lachrymans TaxID=53707 RepID=A0ABR5KRX4_PSEAV|nr:hypothetical protein [Pseudomonas amygdali]AXH59960.1 hypothetical protein PLA107_032560 [Pseudomonas amygdali pv. lachrymans str. M301315]KPC17363.1 Unknown protein sequence [Pseudomonas amygdali pv. lachrymans]RMT05751.1 hypothetical protein ALP54_03821 [Pseudomonas amygdali pv. lachrymans]
MRKTREVLRYLASEISAYFAPLSGAVRESRYRWKASADRFEKRLLTPHPSPIAFFKREFLAACAETPSLFVAPAVGFVKGALRKR